ncbi:MAG: hypothetical protein HQL17_05660 [Candidatus Omnitrophica bacterium]|nr:hypothetical protein [Candidatus Omnitrophota bacterium]
MKILMAVLILMAGLVPVCIAMPDEGYVADKPATDTAMAAIKGSITALKPSDETRHIRAEVTVAADNGDSMNFLVADKAMIQAKDGSVVPFSEIKVGALVSLEYVIYRYSGRKNRVFEAQRISVQP